MKQPLVLFAALAALASGCADPVRGLPRVVEFKAASTRVPEGGFAELRWTVENADRVLLDGEQVAARESREVGPLTGDRVFQLVAENANGTEERELELQVLATTELALEVRSHLGQPIPDCSVANLESSTKTDSLGAALLLAIDSGAGVRVDCGTSAWINGFFGKVSGPVVLPAVVSGQGTVPPIQVTGTTSSSQPLPSGPADPVFVFLSSDKWSESDQVQAPGAFQMSLRSFSSQPESFLPWGVAWSVNGVGAPVAWNGLAVGDELAIQSGVENDVGDLAFEPLGSGNVVLQVQGAENVAYVFAFVALALDDAQVGGLIAQIPIFNGTATLTVPDHPRLSSTITVDALDAASGESPSLTGTVTGVRPGSPVSLALPAHVSIVSPVVDASMNVDQDSIVWEARPGSVYEVRLEPKFSGARPLSVFVEGDRLSLSALVAAGFELNRLIAYRLRIVEYGGFSSLSEALRADGLARTLRYARSGTIATSEKREVTFK